MTTPLSIQKETAMNSEVASPHTPEDAGTGELPICERDDCWHTGTCQGHCLQSPSPPPASMGEGELLEAAAKLIRQMFAEKNSRPLKERSRETAARILSLLGGVHAE